MYFFPCAAPNLEERANDIGDHRRAWDVKLLKRRTKRHRRMRGSDDLDRCIQIVEALVSNHGGDICGHAAARVVFINNNQAMGLANRFQYRFLIKRRNRSWIDDFYLDPLVGEGL